MTTAANILNVIWPYLLGGAGVTVLTQLLKRLVRLENSAVIRLLFHTVTLLITALTFLLGDQGLSAGLLALHASAYSGIAGALFPIVSWLDRRLALLLKALQLISQDAAAVEQAINGAAASAAAADAQVNPPAPANF